MLTETPPEQEEENKKHKVTTNAQPLVATPVRAPVNTAAYIVPAHANTHSSSHFFAEPKQNKFGWKSKLALGLVVAGLLTCPPLTVGLMLGLTISIGAIVLISMIVTSCLINKHCPGIQTDSIGEISAFPPGLTI
jgi:hypothetical protein